MALLFCDSVRHYTTEANLRLKWTGSSNCDYSATAGRSSGPALTLSGTATNFARNFYKTLPSSYATLICGFRFKAVTAFSSTTKMVMAFRDAGNGQCALAINGSGQLIAYKGDYTTTLGSASVNAMLPDTLYYIEVKALIDGANGTFEVRVNGTSTGWLALTGVDTQATANATANQVIFGNDQSNTRTFCDFYVCDTSGSYNTDFLGEVNVDAYLPSGAGVNTDLTPSTGSNYACVDETNPNSTDYVSSGTNGHKDSYAFTDMAGNNPIIKGVANNLWMLKTDSGTVYGKSLVVTGPDDSPPTEFVSANITPGTTYSCYQTIYEVNPATSSAWVKGDVNATEFGVQVSTS